MASTSTVVITPAPRGRNPFYQEGVERGPDGVLRYTNRPPSLIALLENAAKRNPEAVAVAEIGGRRLTYGELHARCAAVAGGLREAGVGRGDRVAIRLPNSLEWVLAFFGIQLAGAVAVPVNMRFTDEEASYVINDAGCSYVFTRGAALPDGPPLSEAGIGPGDLAAIFYTSGTTGFPKGAMMTHENFLSNSESAIRVMQIDRSEGPQIATLVSVPLFHVTGCNSQLIPILEVGGRVGILESALDFEGIVRAVNAEGINHLVTVPAAYYALLHHPAFNQLQREQVRWVSYGGAPMPPELVGALEKAFPNARLGNGFGLTETSSLVSFLPHEEAAAHPDSVGFAVPVVEIAIDPSEGEVGELLVRGQNVVLGYWRKEQATKEAFVQGWLRTGDVARIDQDGLLYIVDRKKDMINRGGENVYSLEVENVLVEAPGVGEVAVVGVPDEMMGEKVGAVIVPEPGATVDPQAVVAFCQGRLADFKIPQYIAIREGPLPRNANGKVLKAKLKEETEWGSPLR